MNSLLCVLVPNIVSSYGTRINNLIVQNNNTNTNLFMDSINHQSLLHPANPIFPPNTVSNIIIQSHFFRAVKNVKIYEITKIYI